MKCPICKEAHALIAVISPTDASLYRCSECGALGTVNIWDTLRGLPETIGQETRDLTDHVDLMVDEFKRIKALCHDKFLHNTEISGLCERAISNTVQRVPVILQRDQAERRAEQLQMVVDKIARVVSGEDQVADDDTDGLIWIRQFIAESV